MSLHAPIKGSRARLPMICPDCKKTPLNQVERFAWQCGLCRKVWVLSRPDQPDEVRMHYAGGDGYASGEDHFGNLIKEAGTILRGFYDDRPSR